MASESTTALFTKTLLPRKPRDVIYDCTHDNPSPLDKFGTRKLHLPQLGLLSMSDIIIASTWGFDQLFLRNYSVVTETRLYPIEQPADFPKYIDSIKTSPFTAGDDATVQSSFDFSFYAPKAHKVAVAGSFNGWKPSLVLDRDSQGIWRKTVQFSASSVHEYKFVINDNEWAFDGSKPTAKDKHGNVNNLLKLE